MGLREHHASWSLRDQSQLDGLTKLGNSKYFTYVYGRDPYAHPQDGAKFVKPVDDRVGNRSDSVPVNQQLRMPIGVDSGSILITWDFWYGAEFRSNVGKLANYKTFQVRQGKGGEGRLWWTHVNRFNAALSEDEFSEVYDSLNRAGLAMAPGVQRREPITPPGRGALGGKAFRVKHSKWTRYWIEVRLSVPADDPLWDDWKTISNETAKLSGRWSMMSLWMADENTEPVRVVYRVPWPMKGTHVASFDFEFNTSSKPPAQTGPLIGYGRNVVVLKDYTLPPIPESDSRIFVRPHP